jgi:CBS domain-containing protein
MKVVESFVRPVVSASPRDSLAAVAGLMETHNVGAVVIVEDHRPVGIVTDRDVALAVAARERSPQTAAAAVMTAPAQTITPREGVFAATLAMKENHVRRLPVVDDNGWLVGIVTLDDVLRVLGRELHNLLDALEPEMLVHAPTATMIWDEKPEEA